jgi:hypothetical protein
VITEAAAGGRIQVEAHGSLILAVVEKKQAVYPKLAAKVTGHSERREESRVFPCATTA